MQIFVHQKSSLYSSTTMTHHQQLRLDDCNFIPGGAEADPRWWPSHWNVEKVIEEEWFVEDHWSDEEYLEYVEEVYRNWNKKLQEEREREAREKDHRLETKKKRMEDEPKMEDGGQHEKYRKIEDHPQQPQLGNSDDLRDISK